MEKHREHIVFFEDILTSPRLYQGFGERRRICMRAVYYDTQDGYFSQMRGALRIRQEDHKSICCMKLLVQVEKGCTTREEYEVAALDVEEGLKLLPEAGAPMAVCAQILAQGTKELCRTEYIRDYTDLHFTCEGDECVGEISFDQGYALREGYCVPFRELEFEFKSGSNQLFHSLATSIEKEFHLAGICGTLRLGCPTA